MKRPGPWAFAVGLAAAGAVAAGLWWWWGRPSDTVRTVLGARPVDVLEDSLRTVAIADADGRTCRLDIPRSYPRVGGDRWPLAVILHTNADGRGSGAASRLASIRNKSWFVLFGEGDVRERPPPPSPDAPAPPPVRGWSSERASADADYVRSAVAQIAREYRLDRARVVVVGERESAPVAYALACGDLPAGWEAVAIDGGAPPCGAAADTARVWVGSAGSWQPIDAPDPDAWLSDWLAARFGR